ncbi:uncharacterized protein LOC116418058 [Nasonia vitripennis]|uniref:RNase H type-1 domain-containing protein n=1 Tax=Nasonia vitripennis TaxID=7425 RepID=A0A7M7TEA7_NASVI|nr:uncharacterized protein LOC116418058 [Nasonia vitripennis]
MGYRFSTPKNVILAETKVTSIKDRALYLGCNYITKALSNESNPACKKIKQFYINHKKSKLKKRRVLAVCINKVLTVTNKILYTSQYNEVYLSRYKAIYHQPSINLGLGKMLNKCHNPNLVLDLFYFDDTLVKLFTDGSKMGDSLSVGSASVTEDLDFIHSRSLDPHSSIFTAEAMAINTTLEYVAESRSSRHIIFSDSLSVLQALQNKSAGCLNHPLIVKAKRLLLEISENSIIENPLQLVWIPAHKEIFGNELADLYAKKATKSPPENCTVPYSDFKPYWKELAYENTVNYNLEIEATKGKQYFENFYTNTKHPWFRNKNLSKKAIVTINRLRADHYSSASSLARKNIVESPACECVHNFQDADHLLWDCPRYVEQRVAMVNSFKKKTKFQ